MHFNAGYLIKEYSYLFDVLGLFFLRDDAVAGCCQKRGAQQAEVMWEGNLRASSSFLPEMPRGTVQDKNDRRWCFGGNTVHRAVLYSNLWSRFLEGHVNVMNKGRVLDAVHSWEAQRLLVAQGVYCIGPKFKAEKESPKIKFSSQCPDFLEKKTERKIDLLWGSIDYQNLNKTKKQYWHRDFQNRNIINKR